LSRKLGYKEKQKAEDIFIFQKDKENLVLNKRQLVSMIRIKGDLFINRIKAVYDNDIIAG
jgi:hypothetical protein